MSLLSLLQLASPALPIGAYSYSEGIEFLAEKGVICDAPSLDRWLRRELHWGSIRIDGGILVRIYEGTATGDFSKVRYWNSWLSAQRETEELRYQSWQMGNSLSKLFEDMDGAEKGYFADLQPVNYASAFAIVSFFWGIKLMDALGSFLFAWAANIVSAGVRSIPIGQTAGQKILLDLHGEINATLPELLCLPDDRLESCNFGLSLASMGHETQYSRLFRS